MFPCSFLVARSLVCLLVFVCLRPILYLLFAGCFFLCCSGAETKEPCFGSWLESFCWQLFCYIYLAPNREKYSLAAGKVLFGNGKNTKNVKNTLQGGKYFYSKRKNLFRRETNLCSRSLGSGQNNPERNIICKTRKIPGRSGTNTHSNLKKCAALCK